MNKACVKQASSECGSKKERKKESNMKNLVLFRLKDDESVWLADLEAGTVERADPSTIDIDQTGEMKGIDFAIAAKARPTAASHLYFPSR
jgi:hypothetical protein